MGANVDLTSRSNFEGPSLSRLGNKQRREASKIGGGGPIGPRGEDLDGDVVGSGRVMKSHFSGDRFIVAPGDHGIEDAIASRCC
jgi:hypothetical protein